MPWPFRSRPHLSRPAGPWPSASASTRCRRQPLRARAGYTIVEVLTVTAILGVISAFVAPHIVYARMRANEMSAQEILRQI